MTAPLLAVEGLEKHRLEAGEGFSLEIPAFALGLGERIALVGPSGTGKSTFIEMLALALSPDRAERFSIANDEGDRAADVAALWRAGDDRALTRLRCRTFGYVQQQGGLLEFLSVAENIRLTQRLSRRPDPERARRLVRELGIEETLGRYPERLSVGQRQRVAIARALAHAPGIVLADEPTASLDLDNADRVMGLLVEGSEESGAALVLSTHDPDLARRFGCEIVAVELDRDAGHLRARFTREAVA